jgi:hypothetical protein
VTEEQRELLEKAPSSLAAARLLLEGRTRNETETMPGTMEGDDGNAGELPC